MSERISSKELCNIYGVTERTLYNWRKLKNLPMLEISPQHKYIYKEDLISWEKSFIHS
jgi:predicted site-specific integrase-resolvase